MALGTVSPVGLIFDAVTAPFLIRFVPTAPLPSFLPVTAPFLSCLVPTLFLPSVTPAYAVPAIATTSAAIATIIAGLGRCGRNRFIEHYLPGGMSQRFEVRGCRIDLPPLIVM